MAARGPRLLYEFLKLMFILNCIVTTIVCQEMVIQHRKVLRTQRSATASPPASVVRGDYGESEDQFGSSLWSLLQTMDAFDTKQFDKGSEQVITKNNSARTVHTVADQDHFMETSIQVPSSTNNGSNNSGLKKNSQGLQRDPPPIVQILAQRSDFSSSSTVQNRSQTHNPISSSMNHSMSNSESEQKKIEKHYFERDEVKEPPNVKFSYPVVTESHRPAATTIPQDYTVYSPPSGASTITFVRESRREDTSQVADEFILQQYPPHRRKNPRGHPSHPQHHLYKPNVERTTQPSRNIMYVVMMQDRPCDGLCCRRESYSGKCRLSLSCAVMHFHKTDMRKLTCGTSYHSLQVPVRRNPSWGPFTTTTPAFPGIVSTNVRKASTYANDTKEAGETSVASTPVRATKSTQSLGGRDPEVAAGNTVTETSSDVDDVDQTHVKVNKTRTFVSSGNGVVAIGNSGVDDSDYESNEEGKVNSWITDYARSNGTIDADVHNSVNDSGNRVLTTEATAKDSSTESSLAIVTSTTRMNQSESVDNENTTVYLPVDIVIMDETNKSLDVFDIGAELGATFDEEVDDGFSEFFDGEYFGSETDDGVLTNETWTNSHNETADNAEFGEFDAYVTDEQSDIDYNDDDYTRDIEYQDDYHYHTDFVEGGVDQGEATNDSPRHLVYTDQVWYGGTDLALGPRELSVQEEVQLSSPNNWHSFGGDVDSEWLNEENKRQPHLVLSSLVDRRPTGRV